MDMSNNDKESFICEYCNTVFSSQKNLTYHIENAKYCLKLQGKSNDKHKCTGCQKNFTTNTWLIHHQATCLDFHMKEKDESINRLSKENEELKDMMKEMFQCIKNGENVSEKLNKIETRIYKRREKYPANVLYVLTTPAMERERQYVFGKTKNLTNRLSTYNKTCEHTVVYFKECKTEEDMDLAEKMVFRRLADCRPDKNRERFVLPEEKEVEWFKEVVNECVVFFETE